MVPGKYRILKIYSFELPQYNYEYLVDYHPFIYSVVRVGGWVDGAQIIFMNN